MSERVRLKCGLRQTTRNCSVSFLGTSRYPCHAYSLAHFKRLPEPYSTCRCHAGRLIMAVLESAVCRSLTLHCGAGRQAEEVEVETRGELIFLLIGAAVAFGAGIWAFMVRCILSVHQKAKRMYSKSIGTYDNESQSAFDGQEPQPVLRRCQMRTLNWTLPRHAARRRVASTLRAHSRPWLSTSQMAIKGRNRKLCHWYQGAADVSAVLTRRAARRAPSISRVTYWSRASASTTCSCSSWCSSTSACRGRTRTRYACSVTPQRLSAAAPRHA